MSFRELPQPPRSAFARFLETRLVPKKKSSDCIVVAPYGPSCVGKSTVMRYLAARLPLVHIEHDAMRLFFRGEGIDENKYLYREHLLDRAGAYFLEKGYSVILDANFATHHSHVPRVERLAKQYRATFFLIRTRAPRAYVEKKLAKKRFLSTNNGGLLPSKKVALEHFLRSSKEFDYDRFKKKTFVVVDSSKPLKPQLQKTIEALREAMFSK